MAHRNARSPGKLRPKPQKDAECERLAAEIKGKNGVDIAEVALEAVVAMTAVLFANVDFNNPDAAQPRAVSGCRVTDSAVQISAPM